MRNLFLIGASFVLITGNVLMVPSTSCAAELGSIHSVHNLEIANINYDIWSEIRDDILGRRNPPPPPPGYREAPPHKVRREAPPHKVRREAPPHKVRREAPPHKRKNDHRDYDFDVKPRRP